jgi:hypothetical protein
MMVMRASLQLRLALLVAGLVHTRTFTSSCIHSLHSEVFRESSHIAAFQTNDDGVGSELNSDQEDLSLEAFQRAKKQERQSFKTDDVADGDGSSDKNENDEIDSLSLQAFQEAKKQQSTSGETTTIDDFDGYQLRDVIVAKFGASYDVAFNPLIVFGFRKLYLNIMPYKLGRRPFRHETELDYLCHLQAVVEILQKYEQLEYVLKQIQETDKKPISGRVPVVAVPIRLKLTKDQVQNIIGR